MKPQNHLSLSLTFLGSLDQVDYVLVS